MKTERLSGQNSGKEVCRMAKDGQTLYIKGEKSREVKKKEVLLGDILKMECTDQAVVNRLKSIRILKIPDTGQKRFVVSVLKLIAVIHEVYPNLTVENLGETDFIITGEDQKKKRKWMYAAKSIFVLLITFIGAAFSIMSFNNDVNAPELFKQIYELITGRESDGFTILEITYCIGMSVGILIFFNHFGKKRFSMDPTPMEVEMRTYEEDIETTLIDEYSRKEQEMDVDTAGHTGSHRV